MDTDRRSGRADAEVGWRRAFPTFAGWLDTGRGTRRGRWRWLVVRKLVAATLAALGVIAAIGAAQSPSTVACESGAGSGGGSGTAGSGSGSDRHTGRTALERWTPATPGARLVAVPLSDAGSLALARPGARIDLWSAGATVETAGAVGPVTEPVVRGARVVEVVPGAADTGGLGALAATATPGRATLLVELTEAEAGRLAAASTSPLGPSGFVVAAWPG